ncbi:MAG: peptidoglycan editing factor PgeF [Firmicutes bacterium]|nr:peptidoglycan editing factor PgeF [Bacillota bacterium]
MPQGQIEYSKRDGVIYLHFAEIDGLGLVTHAFSTRLGGVSKPPCDSLNLGYHVADDPEAVAENRRRFLAVLGINRAQLVTAEQVHGDRVAVVDEKLLEVGRQLPDALNPLLSATDAMVTAIPWMALAIFTADCVPILIVDPVRRAIGAAHAGWQGTVRKIAARTVRAMQDSFGTRPEDCLVALGPSIGPCCYEVDGRVMDRIHENFSASDRLATPRGGGKWLLDLWAANSRSLQETGVKEENLLTSGCCTGCQPGLFFSHRAEKGKSGRMAAIVMLKRSDAAQNGDVQNGDVQNGDAQKE